MEKKSEIIALALIIAALAHDSNKVEQMNKQLTQTVETPQVTPELVASIEACD